jgi:hypothetical protein
MRTRAHHFAALRIAARNPSSKGNVLIRCGFRPNVATPCNENTGQSGTRLRHVAALTGDNSPGRDTDARYTHAMTSENKTVTMSDARVCPRTRGHNSLTCGYSVNGDAR